MPSTYTSSLRLTLPATGENAGTWGNLVNTGITTLIDTSIAGTASITIAGTDYTLSNNNGTTDEARAMFINATGTPGAARNVICPAVSKMYVFRNNTTGGFAMTLKTSAGTGIAVPAGQNRVLYCDGTNVVEAVNAFGSLTLGTALPLTSGGTGQTTAQASMNSFAGAVTSGQYLRGNGTNVVMSAIQAADVPTLNQNTTGTAANVTGTVAVANGGTGQTTFTDGQLLIGNTATTGLTKAVLTAGSGVSITNGNGSISISATGSGGTVTSVGGTGTVNGISLSGTVTSSGNLTLGGTLSNVSLTTQVTGTLPLANGGSGQTTAQAAMNAFAGAVTSGQYLRGNGTNVVMSAIQAADVPTLNQNTTGTAANVTGTVAVANGGTGATTLTANNFLLGNGTSAVTASSLLQVASNYVRPVAYADTVVAAGNTGTALTLTCTNGNVFTATLTGNATITLSTPIGSGSATSITLILTNDGTAGRTVAWAGGSFIFPGGAAALSRTTTANAIDVWVFFTTNGGTTWYGNIAMKDMKA